MDNRYTKLVEVHDDFHLRMGRLMLIRLKLLELAKRPVVNIEYSPANVVPGLVDNALVEFTLVDCKTKQQHPYIDNVNLLRGDWIQRVYQHLLKVCQSTYVREEAHSDTPVGHSV